MFFLLGVAVFCCISITTAASRTLWAFARDQAIPFSSIWSKLIGDQVPITALALLTVVQMLLGLVNLGSTSAFTAFASCGVIALAAAYAIVIAISLFTGRKAVSTARWRCPSLVGYFVNIMSIAWVAFQLVLFSMPAALPVTVASMNYASVVLVGFMFISFVYYVVYGRNGMLTRSAIWDAYANLYSLQWNSRKRRIVMLCYRGCKERYNLEVLTLWHGWETWPSSLTHKLGCITSVKEIHALLFLSKDQTR